MAWMTPSQIAAMGFATVGTKVLLSDRASYYNCPNIRLGSNVRVDDFCVLSAGVGGIVIGDYVHIAVYSLLIGAGRIELADFANLSSRVSVYSSNDDYSGGVMTNPMVPLAYTGVVQADVLVGRHVIVGSGTVILPGITLQEGVAVGALSLVKRDCEAFGVYGGIPAERIGTRSRGLLELEKRLRTQSV